MYLGRWKRGAILFVTVGAIFWAGVALGGVMTVDSRYESWWFAAQSLTGVNGLAGWYRQEQVYKDISSDPDENNPLVTRSGRPGPEQMAVDYELQRRGLALATPTEGVARAYTGVAGMLNLLCIFDAMMLCFLGIRGEPGSKNNRQEPEKPGADDENGERA